MKMILKLRKLATKVVGQKNPSLNYDVDQQLQFLSRLSEPKDDIERSYYQYLCQIKLYGTMYNILVNLAAPFLMIAYLLKYTERKNTIEMLDLEKEAGLGKKGAKALFFTNTLSDRYLPDELTKAYPKLIHAELTDCCGLTKEDLVFFREIRRRYPFAWYFHFKILLKLGVYSKQIRIYKPDAVIVSAEYSFTSSVMTGYCDRNDILHINIQHGEKLLYMEDAFFRFSNCYLWDKVYCNMMIRLKAEPSQFRIGVPPVLTDMKNVIQACKEETSEFDIKYYLASETRAELTAIKRTLEKFTEKEKKVAVRPHPTYSDQKLVEEIFNDKFSIEDPKRISIEKSLAGCKTAVSVRSFALQQAYFGGVETAIDDLSMPEFYKVLEKIEYIMIKRSKKLSQLI